AEPMLAEITLHVGPRGVKHRLDPRALPRAHAGHAREPRPACEPHQQRLQLVVGRVRGGDRRSTGTGCRREKKLAPEYTQPRLAPKAAPAHARRAVPARGLERDLEA